MKRLAIIALFLLTGFGGGNLWSQELAQTTVVANNPEVQFLVDGTIYVGQATFVWPEGSIHVLRFIVSDEFLDTEVPIQYQRARTVRMTFEGWSEPTGLAPTTGGITRVIQANRAITRYDLQVTVEYLVQLRYFDTGGQDPTEGCGSLASTLPANQGPGIVFIDGTCYAGDVDIWKAPGQYSLTAFPYPGYAFTGWGSGQQTANDFIPVLNVQNVVLLKPQFRQAKHLTFLTEPKGLEILVDRTVTPTPTTLPCERWEGKPLKLEDFAQPICYGEFDWAPGETHVLGAPTPQKDRFNHYWVLDGFSNGVLPNEEYTVPDLIPETVTAHFSLGGPVSFVTLPTGLQLDINGSPNHPGYNFIARPGDVFDLVAPPEQVGPDGRKYVFQGWSMDGQNVISEESARTETIPASVVNGTHRVYAIYKQLAQVVISMDPAGTVVQVDGADCATPCRIDRPAGTEVNIAAPPSRTISHAQRLDFQSWSDGGARTRTMTLQSGEAHYITGKYTTMYLLEVNSVPEDGATATIDPPSSDGFYPKGTYVTLTAVPKKGYKFRRWVGALETLYHTGGFNMSVPRVATMMLDEVPYVPEAGVHNAAGETPDSVIAAGSIISIYGSKIAPFLEIGPTNPLRQTLGGVTVWINERALGLLFVSENQINAVLPYDLPPGEYTLVIRQTGAPDVSTKFTMVRNAPGLFTRNFNGTLFVLATHEDGTPVMPLSPARRGETIRVLGTGFGPYQMTTAYGFPLPQAPRYELADPIEVYAGDTSLTPAFAGGAAGYNGTDVIEIKIDDNLPEGATVNFRVRIGGRDSNTALLPLE